ncbi:hypothetical protein [Pontiella sulfatireligans]|uniref:3-keto-disaccharide hydrolase domain-containing protein n=1 Tax=Pontiella sulfatireligans TaxID=2750658 RepID=A0A6C2UD07_9BACT|nr:hypothetical protein [Pontiella sulfatireligans]VGO18005.1 hypothetical protein SCARR_00055 [Pontiella sulfatireligans]
MKNIVLFILLIAPTLWAQPKPLMIVPEKPVFCKEFDNKSDVDKASVKFNKETQYKVEDGCLHAIPPLIAFAGTGRDSKRASSSFSRVNFPELPKDYVCQFRWKYIAPKSKKLQAKGMAYMDMGHRCIRTTLSRDGVKLLLENHMVEEKAGIKSKLLQQSDELKLEDDQWYEVTAEVKGDEVVMQINGHILYGKDDLIAGERANTFNIDINGEGYLLDSIMIWEAGGYQLGWASTKKKLAKSSLEH